MNIPRKIKILGHIITVNTINHLAEHPDGDFCIGMAHQFTNQITISKQFDEVNGDVLDIVESVIAQTFLHEVIHHIENKLGLEMDETQVEGVAAGLFAAIRDNNLDFRGDNAGKSK